MPEEIEKFNFLDPGKLIDDELELVLVKKLSADEEKGYVPAYEFEMRNSKTGEKIGHLNLRIGNNENIKYGGHIGYGVDEKYRGNRHASRGLKLIFPFVKRHDLNFVWITCNPNNAASKRTCEIAGGVLEGIVDLPKDNEQYLRGDRRKCRYKFDLLI